MPTRLTIESAQEAAARRGGVCLSDVYVNRNHKLLWRCSKGHEWWAGPHHVRRGNAWCPTCINRAPPTIADAHKAAQSRNGRCLSEQVKTSSKDPLQWVCEKGHRWNAPLETIKQGRWCPHCAGKRYTIKDMQVLAEARKGLCLSSKYLPQQKLEWQCKDGHTWFQNPSVIRTGVWCPKCFGRGKTIDDMHALATSKGGRCLSLEYQSVMKHLTWQCAKGHVWEATPLNVRRTSWCPQCKTNKSEKKCRKVFESLLGDSFSKCRPAWLRNSRGNQMELDGYSQTLAIAFEYQGFQHYSLGFLHRTPEDFAWQQQRDQEKRDLCKANGVTLIEVPWHVKDKADFIRTRLEELNLLTQKAS